MVSPIVTFIGAILSMIAIALLPGRTAVKKGETVRYNDWGRAAIYFLALVLLVVGGYALVSWYTDRDLFTMGNVILFAVLGFGLIANNIWLTGQVKKVLEQRGSEQVHEVEEIKGPGTGGAITAKGPPAKAPLKKVKRPLTPGAPGPQTAGPPRPVAIKKVKVKKPTVEPKPTGSETEELIEPSSGQEKCPSCDTPLEHTHDGACPVCGEKIPK